MSLLRDYSLLPPLYNTRAGSMWDQIAKAADFVGKTVLDVGCGRGDLALRAWAEGASTVYGIDNSRIELKEARLRAWSMVKDGARVFFMHKDIEAWDERWPGYHDIIICTSVLPYTIDPNKLLHNICRDSKIAFIECQYAGDGPGFSTITNDKQMKNWLSDFDWDEIEKIGYTTVASRKDTTRSIWRCTRTNNDTNDNTGGG